jgi:hypothetical protein
VQASGDQDQDFNHWWSHHDSEDRRKIVVERGDTIIVLHDNHSDTTQLFADIESAKASQGETYFTSWSTMTGQWVEKSWGWEWRRTDEYVGTIILWTEEKELQ